MKRHNPREQRHFFTEASRHFLSQGRSWIVSEVLGGRGSWLFWWSAKGGQMGCQESFPFYLPAEVKSKINLFRYFCGEFQPYLNGSVFALKFIILLCCLAARYTLFRLLGEKHVPLGGNQPCIPCRRGIAGSLSVHPVPTRPTTALGNGTWLTLTPTLFSERQCRAQRHHGSVDM